MIDALRFANLFLFALVAGTYTFEWLVVSSAVRPLPRDRSAQLHDALFHHLPNRYMPWAGGGGGLAALALIVAGDQSDTSTLLYSAGFTLVFASAIVTFALSRRVDKQISEVAAHPDPALYDPLRHRWDQLIALRAPLGLLGFACCIAAALAA
jgi:hypothetical protein